MQRRKFIHNGLLGLPLLAQGIPTLKTGLRVLFVTDMHLSPAIEPSVRAAAFLKQYIHTHPVDLVVNGGDTVYDVAKRKSGEGGEMWDMAVSFFTSLNKPVIHCIGNHDIYEWELHPQLSDTQSYKETVLKRLQMPGRYYACQHGGWKFVVLDSMTHRPQGYRGELDEAQFNWLKNELSLDHDQPVCIVSHIPVVSACDALYLPWERHSLFPAIAERLQHFDAVRIFAATEKANVKLFLHGHLHMRESIQYKTHQIQTHAAFCGDMWKGGFQGFAPGFSMLNLGHDGSVTVQHIDLP